MHQINDVLSCNGDMYVVNFTQRPYVVGSGNSYTTGVIGQIKNLAALTTL